MLETDDFYKGYRTGKTDTIKTLEQVLSSMKSSNDNPTNVIFNLIFDEVLANVLAELI